MSTRGARHAIRAAPTAASTHTAIPSHQSHGQMNVFSTACTASRAVRCVQRITTPPPRSPPACEPSAARYAPRPPLATISGMVQAIAPAAKAAMASIACLLSVAMANASIGSVSTATCERMPIAKPASSAPATSRRSGGFPAISAIAHIAAAKPSMSLSGRSAVNQNSGEAATTSVAHQASVSRPSSRRKNRKTAGMAAAPPSALQIARPRGDAASMPVTRSRPVDAFASAM